MIRSRLTRYAYGVHEREALEFDRRYATDTDGEVPVSGLGLPSDATHEARPYAGSPPGLLRTLLPKVAPFPSRTTFVDLGSGKGRTLLVAAELGFARCIGVEFSGLLHEIAEQNRASFAQAGGPADAVELVHGDAGSFAFPDAPLVVFLNNPFQGAVMRAMLANLEASVHAHPRPVHLIYQSVRGASAESGTAANLRLFEEQGFLRRISPRIWDPRRRALLEPFILRVYRAIT
jgi:SAM-dependent methyltransferase